jgi:ABC-type uncharacterized transport system substrate-binding protein
MIAKVGVIAVLLNPNNPNSESQSNDVQAAAQALDQPIVVLRAATDRDLEAALAALVQQKISAFAVTADSFLFSRLNEIVAFAGRDHLPTMGVERFTPRLRPDLCGDGFMVRDLDSCHEMLRFQ